MTVTFPPSGVFYPSVYSWLSKHPLIAEAIKWQTTAASSNVYVPPTDANKISWPNWDANSKAKLSNAYLDACSWFAGKQSTIPGNLTDTPTNIDPDASQDSVSVAEHVDLGYMWDLYTAHVAFSLAAEIMGQLHWSITGYDSEQLRYLFDSSTMAWKMSPQYGTFFGMGTYDVYVPAKRADNLPSTPFAPLTYTYSFQKLYGLVGATRLETIGRLLDWMRYNLVHFFGLSTFGNCFAVWQYRGYPPLSRILKGTVDANNSSYGKQHWTMGCHGSVGFLNAMLRALNIPVQPVWVCGHELAYFMTEKLYLDHGDDPYNNNVKNSKASILKVLIDEPTYKQWFSQDLTVNIVDPASPACANVGRSAQNFPQS